MHASVRGAALFAAISMGEISLEDVPQLVRVADAFEPDERARSTYEPMYREFKGFYSALHGSYARLNGSVVAQ
jgi:xylulokinase